MGQTLSLSLRSSKPPAILVYTSNSLTTPSRLFQQLIFRLHKWRLTSQWSSQIWLCLCFLKSNTNGKWVESIIIIFTNIFDTWFSNLPWYHVPYPSFGHSYRKYKRLGDTPKCVMPKRYQDMVTSRQSARPWETKNHSREYTSHQGAQVPSLPSCCDLSYCISSQIKGNRSFSTHAAPFPIFSHISSLTQPHPHLTSNVSLPFSFVYPSTAQPNIPARSRWSSGKIHPFDSVYLATH